MVGEIVDQVFEIVADGQHSDIAFSVHTADRIEQGLYLGDIFAVVWMVMLLDEIEKLDGSPRRKIYGCSLAGWPADDFVPDVFRNDIALRACLGEEDVAITAIVEVIPVKYLDSMRILQGYVRHGRLQQGQRLLLRFHGHGCLP